MPPLSGSIDLHRHTMTSYNPVCLVFNFRMTKPRTLICARSLITKPAGSNSKDFLGSAFISFFLSSVFQSRQLGCRVDCCRQSIAAAITDRTTVQDLLEFVCSCCHLNPSVYFIRFNLPSSSSGSCDSFKIPDKTTVVCSEVGRHTLLTLHTLQTLSPIQFYTILFYTYFQGNMGKFSICREGVGIDPSKQFQQNHSPPRLLTV